MAFHNPRKWEGTRKQMQKKKSKGHWETKDIGAKLFIRQGNSEETLSTQGKQSLIALSVRKKCSVTRVLVYGYRL